MSFKLIKGGAANPCAGRCRQIWKPYSKKLAAFVVEHRCQPATPALTAIAWTAITGFVLGSKKE